MSGCGSPWNSGAREARRSSRERGCSRARATGAQQQHDRSVAGPGEGSSGETDDGKIASRRAAESGTRHRRTGGARRARAPDILEAGRGQGGGGQVAPRRRAPCAEARHRRQAAEAVRAARAVHGRAPGPRPRGARPAAQPRDSRHPRHRGGEGRGGDRHAIPFPPRRPPQAALRERGSAPPARGRRARDRRLPRSPPPGSAPGG